MLNVISKVLMLFVWNYPVDAPTVKPLSCKVQQNQVDYSAGYIVPWEHWPVLRSVKTGYGTVIDDLESRAKAGHPMRDTSDPGGWVHELTHYVNSLHRNNLRGKYNSFYVLNGFGLSLPEPKCTLKQVARMVPVGNRGEVYRLYLQEQTRYWNNEPLYILDEATAYANGLWYHVWSGTNNDFRVARAIEFLAYAEALLKTVEKHDPGYKELRVLKLYVEWNSKRVKYLERLYELDR